MPLHHSINYAEQSRLKLFPGGQIRAPLVRSTIQQWLDAAFTCLKREG